jgi:hypothetical protein
MNLYWEYVKQIRGYTESRRNAWKVKYLREIETKIKHFYRTLIRGLESSLGLTTLNKGAAAILSVTKFHIYSIMNYLNNQYNTISWNFTNVIFPRKNLLHEEK